METKKMIWIVFTILVVLFMGGAVVYAIIKTREHYDKTPQVFNIKNMPMKYGSVASNTASGPAKTGAVYETLGQLPNKDAPCDEVRPGMMQLPPQRNIYSTPIWEQKIDPITNMPENLMYTSPRVPLTDFKSETTRDYKPYE